MPNDDEAADPAAYEKTLRRMGVDVAALAPDSAGTICAPPESHDALEEPAAILPVLGGAGGDLRLLQALGEGGMGIVRSAEQRALQRQVAVKTARVARSRGGDASVELVREARITGALEHPNIVPVHALGRSPDGEVRLVMKRIEGVSWAALLAGRAAPHDELRRHIDILVDVSRAVEFAHARGVLHRDLKPANVMVGRFGEVYVLDWGIATEVGARPSAPSGTPAFMAPEMAMPREPLDERTDVYLLGALLHVVLTGAPPHAGRDVVETMQAAWRSAPPELPGSSRPEGMTDGSARKFREARSDIP